MLLSWAIAYFLSMADLVCSTEDLRCHRSFCLACLQRGAGSVSYITSFYWPAFPLRPRVHRVRCAMRWTSCLSAALPPTILWVAYNYASSGFANLFQRAPRVYMDYPLIWALSGLWTYLPCMPANDCRDYPMGSLLHI
jgi:hypothetical protein